MNKQQEEIIKLHADIERLARERDIWERGMRSYEQEVVALTTRLKQAEALLLMLERHVTDETRAAIRAFLGDAK